VPEFLRLLGQLGDKMRVRMSQRVHGDAGGKVQITFAIFGNEPYAFAPLEGEVDTREGPHQMRCHGTAREICAVMGAVSTTQFKRNVPPLRAARSNIVFPRV